MGDPLPAGEQPPKGEQGSTMTPPVVQPEVVTPAVSEPSSLSRDTPIVMTDSEGKTISPTIGEMADVFRDRPSVEDLKEMVLYKKAVKEHDPAAARDLFNLYAPEPAPTTPVPGEAVPDDKRVRELEEKVVRMEAVISKSLSPVVDQITNEARVHQARLLIEAGKDKYPYLSRVTRGAQLVDARRKQYKQLAKDKDYDLDAAPAEIQGKVMERAMQDMEKELKDTYEEISGVKAPAPGQGIVSVNDQGSSKETPGSVPPRYRMNRDGAYVDESPDVSRYTSGEGGQPASEPLSAVPVAPAPSGSPVGVRPDAGKEGPMDTASMTDRMRQRREQLGGVL